METPLRGSPPNLSIITQDFILVLEPSFQIVPRLGIKLKLHYIVNISDKIKDSGLNQGVLYSAQIPIDITEKYKDHSNFGVFSQINQMLL